MKKFSFVFIIALLLVNSLRPAAGGRYFHLGATYAQQFPHYTCELLSPQEMPQEGCCYFFDSARLPGTKPSSQLLCVEVANYRTCLNYALQYTRLGAVLPQLKSKKSFLLVTKRLPHKQFYVISLAQASQLLYKVRPLLNQVPAALRKPVQSPVGEHKNIVYHLPEGLLEIHSDNESDGADVGELGNQFDQMRLEHKELELDPRRCVPVRDNATLVAGLQNPLSESFMRAAASACNAPLPGRFFSIAFSDQGRAESHHEASLIEPKFGFAGIFTGSGPNGSEMAAEVQRCFLRECTTADGNFSVDQFRNASQVIDEQIKSAHGEWYGHSGVTLAACHIADDDALHWVNCGDLKILVASRRDFSVLNEQHSANSNKKELVRMKRARVLLSSSYRLPHGFFFTRAVGYGSPQLMCKGEKAIRSEADYGVRKLPHDLDFIIIASAELWDCMTEFEVVHFVKKQRLKFPDGCAMTPDIADYTMRALLHELRNNPERSLHKRTKENISVTIIYANTRF